MIETDRDSLAGLRAELARLAAGARETAQAANNSAGPELVDALDQVLSRIETWDASAASSTEPEDRERLLREGQGLIAVLRNLPILHETA